MAEEKTFAPTKRRLDEARREGKTVKSQILTQTLVVSTVVGVLIALVRCSWVRESLLVNYCFINAAAQAPQCGLWAMREALVATLMGLGAGAAVALLAETLQVGVRVEPTLVSLRFDRLNPARGLGRLMQGVRQVWRLLVNGALVGGVLVLVVTGIVEASTQAFARDAFVQVVWLQSALRQVMIAAGMMMLMLGGFEFLLNRRRHLRDLSMSVDEMRREYREQEGDPHLKAMRRSLHETLLAQDLAKRVRKARVIVVERNSTGRNRPLPSDVGRKKSK